MNGESACTTLTISRAARTKTSRVSGSSQPSRRCPARNEHTFNDVARPGGGLGWRGSSLCGDIVLGTSSAYSGSAAKALVTVGDEHRR